MALDTRENSESSLEINIKRIELIDIKKNILNLYPKFLREIVTPKSGLSPYAQVIGMTERHLLSAMQVYESSPDGKGPKILQQVLSIIQKDTPGARSDMQNFFKEFSTNIQNYIKLVDDIKQLRT